ncbi:MAG: NAD-dependent epimerase/dehydratase family protein, partial [bacterium]|nr:NAD-dependent epimerase/dehydratase family protein [bacterium]
MRILLTGAASDLGRALATALETDKHQLCRIDTDLTDAAAMWRAVRGMDAVMHTGEPPSDTPRDPEARAAFLLDYYSRGTHVLFKAAVDAGVRRFVYGSTLDLFRPYADDVYISEMWRPLPTPHIEPMARYLG